MRTDESYYSGMEIISRTFFKKINAGQIKPVISRFNRTTGETLFADQPPPEWAQGLRDLNVANQLPLKQR